MMRILVCGGRDYRNRTAVNRVLDGLHRKHGIDTIIQGGANGADRCAAEWGWDHDIEVLSFPADWQAHGKAAGPLRNQRMIDEGMPEGVVAFPGGAGTADIIARAEKAGLKVWKPSIA